ncbi:hypothetical protein DE20_20215 [Salmonella enterica subsp. enterica serovar Typhimurium var. 5-]|nr:hypothetical protein DE20_20215 [Salmonella enterica subsp. enterica serovar Typhimurium var. 5-]KUE40482.1 hypothetical protein DF08_20555 [Salmonella enterica subsp. enterica serovar Derby]
MFIICQYIRKSSEKPILWLFLIQNGYSNYISKKQPHPKMSFPTELLQDKNQQNHLLWQAAMLQANVKNMAYKLHA